VRDVNRELVKFHLEDRGYLVSFGIVCTHECLPARDVKSRSDLEIDVVAVKLSGGRIDSAVIGCIKGYWTAGSQLTPSIIRKLEDDKRVFTRAFSDARLNFARGRYGLGEIPLEKVLFYSLRSPKKSEEVQRTLADQGIHIVYLEDIIADILPRLKREPHLAESETLQTLKALKGTKLFARAPKPKGGGAGKGDGTKSGRRRRKKEAEPHQLDLL